MFLDSHAHLDGPQFTTDRDAAIQRAYDAGIRTLLAIGNGDGPDDLACAIPFAERYPWIYASIGVHPHEARLLPTAHLDRMQRLARHPRVIAFGGWPKVGAVCSNSGALPSDAPYLPVIRQKWAVDLALPP